MTTLKINIKNPSTLQKILQVLSQFDDVEVENKEDIYSDHLLKAKERVESGKMVTFTDESFKKFSEKILKGESINIEKVIKEGKNE